MVLRSVFCFLLFYSFSLQASKPPLKNPEDYEMWRALYDGKFKERERLRMATPPVDSDDDLARFLMVIYFFYKTDQKHRIDETLKIMDGYIENAILPYTKVREDGK